MKKYFVNIKPWHNNWSDPVEVEEYEELKTALTRAREINSFTCEYIGNNNYVCNGLETWVDDEAGNHYNDNL